MASTVKDRLMAALFTMEILHAHFAPFNCIAIMLLQLRSWLWFIPVLYAIYYWYDRGSEERGGWRWIWHSSLTKAYFDYFPVRLVKTYELSPEKNYIFGSHPHAYACYGARSVYRDDQEGFSAHFPGISPRLHIHSHFFHWPILREFSLASGFLSVARRSLKYMLGTHSKGIGCVIVIGGAREALADWTNNIVLVLKERRKGFVRLAIEHGADLVPTFSFGEIRTHHQVPVKSDSIVRKLQEWLLESPIISFHVAYGRAALFGTRGLAPFRVPITVVVGRPINVTQMDAPDEAYVDLLHNKYVEALLALYDEYNPLYGDKKMSLVIK